MIRKDYLMNQLELLVSMGAKLIFRDQEGRESILVYDHAAPEGDRGLLDLLVAMVGESRIDDAENRLFEEAEMDGGLPVLYAGIRFYAYLNGLEAGKLKEAGFSREEIRDGFGDFIRLYGIVDIVI